MNFRLGISKSKISVVHSGEYLAMQFDFLFSLRSIIPITLQIISISIMHYFLRMLQTEGHRICKFNSFYLLKCHKF